MDHLDHIFPVRHIATVEQFAVELCEDLADVEYHTIRDDFRRQLVHRLRCSMLGVKEEKTVQGEAEITSTLSFPSSWWQHVKLRFAPRWWLRRYPVLITLVDCVLHRTTHVTKTHRFCPHLKTEPYQRHVEFLTYGNENDRRCCK